MSFSAILKSDKIWTMISAIASAIAAISACIAIIQVGLIFKTERESKRPYFEIVEATILKKEDGQKCEFKVALENIGINPAADPRIKILVKNKALNEDLFGIAYDFADEIPKGSKINFYRENIETNKNEEDWYYVILAVRYFDPILKKDFAQLFLQQWRSKTSNLERVLIPQRDTILENQKIEYPLTDSNVIKQIWK
jgi:hypothetical protein